MSQSRRTLQEYHTPLSPAEVLDRAKAYFAKRHGIYATFLEQESPTHMSFRGQGGEELVIGVAAGDGGTRVSGSTYLFDMQVARFFTMLPASEGSPVATVVAPRPEATA